MNQSIDDKLFNDYETELIRSNMRKPLRDLPINPCGISPYSTGLFHCVEAIVEKSSGNTKVLRLRVITNQKCSVRVTIAIKSAFDYHKFLFLRNSIRNFDTVLVELEGLTVSASSNGFGEIYLRAKKYRVVTREVGDEIVGEVECECDDIDI